MIPTKSRISRRQDTVLSRQYARNVKSCTCQGMYMKKVTNEQGASSSRYSQAFQDHHHQAFHRPRRSKSKAFFLAEPYVAKIQLRPPCSNSHQRRTQCIRESNRIKTVFPQLSHHRQLSIHFYSKNAKSLLPQDPILKDP